MATARRYTATSRAEFDRIGEWVDDSFSATDQLFLDADRGELVISFESDPPWDEGEGFPQPTLIRTGLLGRYFRQPYFRCRLTVRRVTRTEPDLADLEEPVMFGFPELDREAGTIFFASNTDSAFTVLVTALDLELEVSDEIAYHRKHGYGRGIPWTSQGRIID